jgi:hypothetical protein
VSSTPGHSVELLTVKAQLTERALARLDAAVPHFFCPDAACAIVYFDARGNRYGALDVRAPVSRKTASDARIVCYCFGETERGITRELQQHGKTDAVARVRAHIKAGRCACEIRNPRGVCCLGELIAAVNRLSQAMEEQQS